MSLKRDKYDIEVIDDDAKKRNQMFFDLMQQTFNCLDGSYMDETFILINTIKIYQLRKQSTAEIEKLNREKSQETKKRRVHVSLIPKNTVL